MIEWLADTMIATTMLMGLVLLVRDPVARLCGAKIAYALWLLPAARLFMPALSKTIEIAPSAPSRPALSPETALAIADAVERTRPFDWTPVGLTLWLGGAGALFLWRTASYRREREDILAEAQDVESIGGIRLVEAPAVTGPVAFGLFDRVIAVPPAFYRNYTQRERELALAHELAHHRSGDLHVNLAAFGLLCLHWFNPVAWLAWRAFRFDQEAACDARVLEATGSEDHEIYGRAIAKAASGRPLIFASALHSRKSLKKRLANMAMNDTSRLRRIAGLTAIGAGIVIALPLTATVSYAYVQPAAPVAPTAPQAPDAPFAPQPPQPLQPAEILTRIGGDQNAERTVEVDGNGEIRRTIVRRPRGEDYARIDHEELRRSIEEGIPSREELRRIIEEDIPSREELAAMIPDVDVEERCDGSPEAVRSEVRAGANGRPASTRVIICSTGLREQAMRAARDSLREARDDIASGRDDVATYRNGNVTYRRISAEERAKALADIDREIARLDSETR